MCNAQVDIHALHVYGHVFILQNGSVQQRITNALFFLQTSDNYYSGVFTKSV